MNLEEHLNQAKQVKEIVIKFRKFLIYNILQKIENNQEPKQVSETITKLIYSLKSIKSCCFENCVLKIMVSSADFLLRAGQITLLNQDTKIDDSEIYRVYKLDDNCKIPELIEILRSTDVEYEIIGAVARKISNLKTNIYVQSV